MRRAIRMRAMVAGMIVIALLFGMGSVASATVTGGASDAYNIKLGVSALGLINVNIGPTTLSEGTAPVPYNESDSLLNVNLGAVVLGTGATVDAGVFSTSADSNVNGSWGSRYAEGSQEIVGLDVDASVTLFPTILDINSSTINSDARVAGNLGALVTTGSSYIENLTLTVLNVPINLSAYLNASLSFDPNTVVDLNVLGLTDVSLILNEQISSNNGSKASMEVNAIHLIINGHSLLGSVLNAEVIVGHSYAELTASQVPEPSMMLLFGSGLLGLAAFRRHLKK